MSHLWSVRRARTALVASALTASVVVGGTTPAHAVSSSSPAGHGATWLAGQLNHKHLIRNKQFKFNDYGLTIDTAFALQAIGGHRKDVAEVAQALRKHADDVFSADPSVFAGSLAKLLVLAEDTRSGPRSFGGDNLVRLLAHRVIGSGPSAGRIQDVENPSFPGDTANVVGQVFAVRGLLKAGNDAAPSALEFLLQQQCKQGFFRLDFNPHKAAAHQGCGKRDRADTDVTALAVVQLAAVTQGHGRLGDALGAATAWLKTRQGARGGLGGAGPTAAANANSTGLAGWAFLTAGTCGAARDAAHWLADHQVTGDLSGTKLAGERGAIAYDNDTMTAARQDGITRKTRDKWRRATSQAAPALLALSRC
jgi:hypothetical protein